MLGLSYIMFKGPIRLTVRIPGAHVLIVGHVRPLVERKRVGHVLTVLLVHELGILLEGLEAILFCSTVLVNSTGLGLGHPLFVLHFHGHGLIFNFTCLAC